jgi:prepilin-type processing-associated H-X9-DG protein
MAFRMYADDNADFLPRRGQGIQVLFVINRPEDWFNALPAYFGLTEFQQMVALSDQPAAHTHSLFVCPSATDPGATYFLPYGMNMNLSPWSLARATKFGEVIRPANVVAMADAPGPYASTFPSTRPYSVMPRHCRRVNLLFLDGQVQSFAGAYVGAGVGDPHREDVRWLTGTASDAQAGSY